MIKLFVFLFLIPCIAYAALNDYGIFLSNNQFNNKCVIRDRRISGLESIIVYNRNEEECGIFQDRLDKTYFQILSFFNRRGIRYIVSVPKNIVIRVLYVSELNNPNNFSGTESSCMYGIIKKCSGGVYVGRSFFHKDSTNINIYITYNTFGGNHSTDSTIKHEIFHTMLHLGKINMSEKNEHKLINDFLSDIK